MMISFFPIVGISQVGNVVDFTVKKPDVVISVLPNDSVFWQEKRNHIFITVEEGKSKLNKAELTVGRLTRIGPTEFVASFDSVCETVLKVYERLPNGKSRLAIAKPYKVIEKPMPTVTVAGVAKDSAVGIKRLLHIGALQVDLKDSPVRPAIIGYKMVIGNGEQEKVFVAAGHKLTLAMRNQIRRLAAGQTIEFRDIIVLMPDGGKKTVETMSVFLVETDEYNIGRSGTLDNR